MNAIDISIKASELIFTGELTRNTISPSFEKKSAQLITNEQNVFNLAAVSKIDTAGLAWLLLMLEQAGKRAIKLKFIHIPDELTKLAKLSAVDSFLPVE